MGTEENEVSVHHDISKNDKNVTMEHTNYNKLRVLPKRSSAILEELKRRFNSDRT